MRRYVHLTAQSGVSISNRESRYLLIITENYAALRIVQQHLLSEEDDPVLIFGSSFPKDLEYTQVWYTLYGSQNHIRCGPERWVWFNAATSCFGYPPDITLQKTCT